MRGAGQWRRPGHPSGRTLFSWLAGSSAPRLIHRGQERRVVKILRRDDLLVRRQLRAVPLLQLLLHEGRGEVEVSQRLERRELYPQRLAIELPDELRAI